MIPLYCRYVAKRLQNDEYRMNRVWCGAAIVFAGKG
jgi:hypothetical protein